MSAASFWEALKAGALRQPRVCQWPGCAKPKQDTQASGEAS
jgi:hypothetical protein